MPPPPPSMQCPPSNLSQAQCRGALIWSQQQLGQPLISSCPPGPSQAGVAEGQQSGQKSREQPCPTCSRCPQPASPVPGTAAPHQGASGSLWAGQAACLEVKLFP